MKNEEGKISSICTKQAEKFFGLNEVTDSIDNASIKPIIVHGAEEYVTPGNEMSVVLHDFLNVHSKMFRKSIMTEKSITNDHKNVSFEIVQNNKVYQVKFVVHDNMAMGYKGRIFEPFILN